MRIIWRLNPVVGIVEVCLWYVIEERKWTLYSTKIREFGQTNIMSKLDRLWTSLDILDDPVPSVYSFPLCDDVVEVLKKERARLETHATGDVVVKTLYHGTATEHWESIKTHGLFESNGMLGAGVYLTHAARAANRYGSRDRDYLVRAPGTGCCVRVYLMVEAEDNIARSEDYLCACADCADKDEVVRRVCDHESIWQTKLTKHGVRADAAQRDNGKWVIRSTEWCVMSEGVFVQDAVLLDADVGTYDPEDMSIHPLPF